MSTNHYPSSLIHMGINDIILKLLYGTVKHQEDDTENTGDIFPSLLLRLRREKILEANRWRAV